MRLAVVIERYESQHGGAERSTAQIVGGLVGRGHQVTVIAGCSPPDEPSEGFKIERFATKRAKRREGLLRFSRWARHVLDIGDFDASLSMTMAVPATVLQPRGGTVRETIERNIQIRPGGWGRMTKRLLTWVSPKQRLMLSLERRVLADRGVRRIVAVSGYVADQLSRHYSIGGDRVVVVPNAAEVPAFDALERARWRREVREGFGVPEDGLVYLFSALNPRLKGADTLLRAVRVLADRGVEMTLLMAGDIGYAQQHQAAGLGVRDRVKIVGPTQHMSRLYAASDVTVHPTFYDPASKVVIESLMMGVPAISTVYNGSSDLIIETGAGGGQSKIRGRVIDDPGDPVALADAMAALADPDERGRCTAATAGLADRLSMSRHVDRLESILLDVYEQQCVTSKVDGGMATAVGS